MPKLLKAIIERFENRVINASSTTIICTEERREQISKSKPHKIVVIHNSPDLRDLIIKDEKNEYDYVYCGGLLSKRLVDKILDLYEKNSDLKMLFAGPGEKNIVEKAIRLDGQFSNFSYIGQISYKDVLNYEMKSTCLSAVYDPSLRNHKLCAPNKFYEALALGKPIVVCRGTGIDRYVEQYDLGFVIEYDANEFYNALRTIKDRIALSKRNTDVQNFYNQNLSWDLMKKRLVTIYDELLLQ